MAGEGNPFGRILLPRRVQPHRVNIFQSSDLDDDAGGRIPQPVPVSVNVPCWVQDLSESERIEFGRNDVVFSTRVVFLQNPGDIKNDYLIQFGTRLLRVKTIQNELGMNLVWTVMTEEVT